MALLPWDDGYEENKDDLFGAPSINRVTSVQSGAWQPAPSGADSAVATDDMDTSNQSSQAGIFQQSQPVAQQPPVQNYLMSDEKTRVDQQKQQRDAEIEAARQQAAARQRAEAAAKISQQFQEGQARTSQGQPIDVKALKDDNGWKKYYQKAFDDEKKGMGFFDKLMDGGQASRRAEVIARNRYASELLRKAYDGNGNVLDPQAALQAKGVTAYNSALAQDNITRGQVLARAIGATKDNEGSGFWNRLKNAVNAEKQMNVGSAALGVDDTTKTDLSDLGRFGSGLVQGIGTMPVIGAKELYETARGRGTNYDTGFEGELTPAQRMGRGVSGALNVVTPFIGGSGRLLDSLTTKVLTGSATAAEASLLKQLTAKILMPAIEQGGIGAAQAGGEYFGNGGSLLDENGDFDKKKLAQFAKEVGTAGAMSAAGGAVLAGAGEGVRAFRQNRMPTLDAGELAALETNATNSGEAQMSANRRADSEGAALQAFERGEVSPAEAPVADGIASPDTPLGDAPPQVADRSITSQNIDTAPAPSTSSTLGLLRDDGAIRPADGVIQTAPVDVAPVRDAPLIDQAIPADAKSVVDNAPVPSEVTPVTKPVADGVVQPPDVVPVSDTPVVPTEQVRALQESRAGKSQAEEAALNQKLAEVKQSIPAKNIPEVDNVPEGMGTDTSQGKASPSAKDEMIDRAISVLDEPKEYISQVADAISEPGKSPIKADDMRETLDMYDGKGDAALKERIATKYERLKAITIEMNKPQLENRKNLKEGGIALGDSEITKSRSELQNERGRLEKDLSGDIKRLVAQTSGKERAALIYNNLKNYRKSNMLFGASNIERQAPQDILGLLNDVVKNPIKMGKALTSFPQEYVKSLESAARQWTLPPKTLSEVPKYILGNAYESAVSLVGVEGAVRARTNAYRNVEARNILTKLGYDVTKENIDKMSKMMGNEAELMAHTAAGVANFMTSNTQFRKASDAYNAYLDGNPLERAKFLENVSKQSTVAAQIKQQLFKSDNPMAHIAAEVIDFVAPFVRTASNAFDTTVTQTLNPFSKTAADYILASNRSKGRNALAIAQSAAMDGALIAGTVGLIGSGTIVYNNGDDVDKPRGISIKVSDDKYIPIRATHVELTVATVYAATQLIKDIDDGSFKASSIKDYVGMLDNSLPYVDSLVNTNKAISSATSGEDGDNNYAAKAYGLNTAKSFVPASNNGVQPWLAGRKGLLPGVDSESVNAKSTYDKNPAKWFGNILNNSYGRGGYLPDSRDAAGRVRTSDSQGAFVNKHINDANTAEFNDRITGLVDYGKKNGLGKGVQDMFNTYPTDKNNNFKSIQDSITFLDEPSYGGKAKPDNANKLKKNPKLANLSEQIRNGFFGDSGSELLTLDGQNLKSDASVPNSAGTKNTKLPISMQSIRNAIAQTDLPKEESDKLYALSQQSTDLYGQLKAKSITYDQYSAAKAQLSKQEMVILRGSKSYKKLSDLMGNLSETGFFEPDGLGATKSGQTYLWNALNSLLASKGATPAAQYPDNSKGFTPWGFGNRGTGRSATNKFGDRGNKGIQWTPVGKRQLATVQSAKYTPVNIKVKLGNEIKKDRTQNYRDRSF